MAAPVFDSATSLTATSSAGFSITHVVGSNSNRAVVAGVGSSSAGGAALTSSSSYNSVALEELIDLVVGDIKTSLHMTTAEPASGSHSFTFALAAADDEVGAGVADYHDVHQTTPHGTAASSSGTSTTATSGTVTSAADEVVFGCCYVGVTALAPTAPTTQRFENESIGGFSAFNGADEVGAASVALVWTQANAVWVTSAVGLKPAGAAAAPPGIYTRMVPTQRMI